MATFLEELNALKKPYLTRRTKEDHPSLYTIHGRRNDPNHPNQDRALLVKANHTADSQHDIHTLLTEKFKTIILDVEEANKDNGGTTATMTYAYIEDKEKKVTSCFVGDSPVVILEKIGGQWQKSFSTEKDLHDASNKREAKRVTDEARQARKSVEHSTRISVQGSGASSTFKLGGLGFLQLSRTIGDYFFKGALEDSGNPNGNPLRPNPSIFTHTLSPEAEDYLVFTMSDGIEAAFIDGENFKETLNFLNSLTETELTRLKPHLSKILCEAYVNHSKSEADWESWNGDDIALVITSEPGEVGIVCDGHGEYSEHIAQSMTDKLKTIIQGQVFEPPAPRREKSSNCLTSCCAAFFSCLLPCCCKPGTGELEPLKKKN